ncbi:VOC family protein [Novosphingobium flavum]|nr:VOC family protein [Novosphingobium flavum]
MQTKTGINGVARVHFGLPDLEAAVRYYEDWGLTIVARDVNRVYLRGTGPDHFLLALHRCAEPQFLCADISIETREQADALHAALCQAGVTEISSPGPLSDPGGGYGFAFRDPGERRPFRVITEVENHANTGDYPDRTRKVAHLVFNSPNRDDPFFVDYLGFKVIDRSKTITFLNCNSDHHSLAFYVSVGSSFNHLALEVPDIDSVMSATAKMVERGEEIGWGVGRHGPCNNVFCYFVGPGGFIVEYTAEVEQVDETYKVGGPNDWHFPPGRRDQWGLALPTPRMRSAEARVPFADALFPL